MVHFSWGYFRNAGLALPLLSHLASYGVQNPGITQMMMGWMIRGGYEKTTSAIEHASNNARESLCRNFGVLCPGPFIVSEAKLTSTIEPQVRTAIDLFDYLTIVDHLKQSTDFQKRYIPP